MKTVLEVDPRLVTLLSRGREPQTVFGYDNVPGDVLAACEAQISMGSLGQFLRRDSASFPDVKPNTLVPNKTKQSELRARYEALAQGQKIVGISWHSTNPSFGIEKSLPLDHWAPILQCKNIVFVSLQYGDAVSDTVAAEAATGTEVYVDPNVDPMADLDLAAAQIAVMDLVVSISNTATHMAGAMGKEAWVMVPKVPEWRWGLEGDQSLWYSQVRIFRQAERGAWASPVHTVAKALNEKFEN